LQKPAKKAKNDKTDADMLEAMFQCSSECAEILDRLSAKNARIVIKDLASRYAK
jgi:hypothetical protein